MTPADALHYAIMPALGLMPREMTSRAAIAMLLAIGMQESRFQHRRQIRGPARGWWQFEVPGVVGVLTHGASSKLADEVCDRLGYTGDAREIQAALEHNDLLAAAFARLLLWTVPAPLPRMDEPDEGWRQYRSAWRPGRPHPETWADYYRTAWEMAV